MPAAFAWLVKSGASFDAMIMKLATIGMPAIMDRITFPPMINVMTDMTDRRFGRSPSGMVRFPGMMKAIIRDIGIITRPVAITE